MEKMFSFASFDFPRTIPEFRRSQYNTRLLKNGKTVPARMRFAYRVFPEPLNSKTGSFGFYYGSDFAPNLRIGFCKDVEESSQRRRSIGYDTSFEDGGDKLFGIIARLPSRRGFLAGYSFGQDMAAILSRRIYADLEDAVTAANEMAEQTAYESRCIESVRLRRADYDDMGTEITEIRRHIRQIIADFRQIPPEQRQELYAIRLTVGRRIAELRERIHSLNHRRQVSFECYSDSDGWGDK